MAEVRKVRLGEVAYEYKERIGEEAPDRPVYGVDKSVGLTAEPRYQSSNLSRYKRIEHGMFAYNPMRLNIGSIGFCHDDLAPGIVSPDYVVFGCREGALLPKFMDYHTRSAPWSDWLSLAGEGSVRERIYFRKLETYEMALPEVTYQAAAVEILSSLDNKIELNRRMNETLEALAQAIFKDWFVTFDPTRRKMDGATDPVAILGGLIPDPAKATPLAALFPDTFGENGLPKGWKTCEMKELCGAIANGGTPKRDMQTYWEPATIPWLTSGEVRNPYLIETSQFISAMGLENSSAKWVEPFATVVALYGATAGQVALVVNRMTTNQAICALTAKDGYRFLIYLALSANKVSLASMATGSAQQNLSKRLIESYSTVDPGEAAKKFDDLVAPLFERIIANELENRTLAETRDYLLPKLMSGTVRVRDVEPMAE